MRESKRNPSQDDMNTIFVGGDGEAEPLNGEVGGTTSRPR